MANLFFPDHNLSPAWSSLARFQRVALIIHRKGSLGMCHERWSLGWKRGSASRGHSLSRSGSEVVHVDVDARVNVVEQVPARVVGVIIDDKIIAAIPAPVRAERPVPGRDFKTESTREPEAMMVAVKAQNAVAVRRAKALEVPVFERMIHVEPRIVGLFVAVPVVVVDVRRAVHAIGVVTLDFGCRPPLGACRRRRGQVTLIGARRARPMTSAMLRKNRDR